MTKKIFVVLSVAVLATLLTLNLAATSARPVVNEEADAAAQTVASEKDKACIEEALNKTFGKKYENGFIVNVTVYKESRLAKVRVPAKFLVSEANRIPAIACSCGVTSYSVTGKGMKMDSGNGGGNQATIYSGNPIAGFCSSYILSRVRSGLGLWYPRLRASEKDGVITLSGTVQREEDKKKAEQIATESGAKQVLNNLKVTPR